MKHLIDSALLVLVIVVLFAMSYFVIHCTPLWVQTIYGIGIITLVGAALLKGTEI